MAKKKADKQEELKYEEEPIIGVVKVNDKGQVIIPAEIRKKLNIQPGDQLMATVSRDGKGVMLMKMGVFYNLFSRYYNPDMEE
ncbi:MAG: hypothetical protein CVV44_06940 [Spirochaetae bacterium HGW-Spirochaetae-1]|jgi:AbrB family looped-hinge helix DNA binding protein|nr:MAG: hypothetical protein CVV44_06940 [Spirochaetae bacterium HGW-Spirochaetae-1]